MTQDVADLLEQACAMPYGAARVAALEAVVRHADAKAPDTVLPFEARREQIYSYIAAGERVKSFVPFAWCLAEFDRDPQRYAEFELQLLWAFKWQPDGFTRFPEVPLARTHEFLDDMEARYLRGGHSAFAVHQLRLAVARHLGDTEAAAGHYQRWEATRPDALADCKGCWPTAKVAYLIEAGRHTDALRVADPVLQGAMTCHEQPQGMLTALLPAYVALGEHEKAADAHRRAYRIHRQRRADLESVAEHVVFLARTGNEVRALELIEDHLRWLDAPDSPWAALRFSAAAALALSRLAPDTEVHAGGGAVPAALLGAELAERARVIAARFDERNGNGFVGETTEQLLVAEPWVDELPLSAAARRAQEVRRRLQPAASATTVEPTPDLPAADLLDEFERLWWAEEAGFAADALARFEREVPVEQRSVAQQARVLEQQGLLVAREDPTAAGVIWRTALPLLEEAGEQVRLLRTRARIARSLAAAGELAEALATGEAPYRWLLQNDHPERQPGWAVGLAALLMESRAAEADALLDQLRSGPLAGRDELRAVMLHIEVLHRLEDWERLDACLDRAVDLASAAEPLLEANARSRRGWLRLQGGDAPGAVADLAEAHALLTALDAVSPYLLLDLGAAQLHSDDAEAAAEAGEQALRLLAGDEAEAYPRRLLVDAYFALGDLEPVLAHLEALLGLEEMERQPHLLEQQGVALQRLERDVEAIAAFLAAADAFPDAADQVRALRRAGESAVWADDYDQAASLRTRIEALLGELPDEDAAFHRAGLLLDEATALARTGDPEEGARRLEEAEGLYHRIGAGHLAEDCLLRRAELGVDPGPHPLQEVHDRAEPGSHGWFRSGYLLATSLRAAGRGAEATEVEAKLER